jgi:putative Mn2+ efflux pump MntP
MSFVSILLLAVGLAMDATAVAAARGLAIPRVLPRHVALVAGFFGGFQALMPLIGFSIGSFVGARVGAVMERFDHWVAFVLLGAIGGKMLWEARGGDDDDDDAGGPDPFAWKAMFVLAVATSIDALAVGVTLPMLGADLWLSLVTIGVTTAVLSALGLYAGRRFGALLGKRLDAIGGIVLVGLGAKILIEHLSK